MREQTWNGRQIASHHERWYQHITTLELLTHEWQTLAPKLSATEISNIPLEELLDESLPDELLTKLEKKIWTTQALILSSMKKYFPELEQISWKAGFNCAENRWKNLSADTRSDLRGVLAALRECPMSGLPKRQGFLITRALSNQIELDLLFCPHESLIPEVQAVASKLCSLHSHWMRGFIQHLNPRVDFTYLPCSSTHLRCGQKWVLQK